MNPSSSEFKKEAIEFVQNRVDNPGSDGQTEVLELAIKYDRPTVIEILMEARRFAEATGVPPGLIIGGPEFDASAAGESPTPESINNFLDPIYEVLGPEGGNETANALTSVILKNPGQAIAHTDKMASLLVGQGADPTEARRFLGLYAGLSSGMAAEDIQSALEVAQTMHGITADSMAAEMERMKMLEWQKLLLVNAMASTPKEPSFKEARAAYLAHPVVQAMPGTPAQKIRAGAILVRRATADERSEGKEMLKQVRSSGYFHDLEPRLKKFLVDRGYLTSEEAGNLGLYSQRGLLEIQRAGPGDGPEEPPVADPPPEGAQNVVPPAGPAPTPAPTPTPTPTPTPEEIPEIPVDGDGEPLETDPMGNPLVQIQNTQRNRVQDMLRGSEVPTPLDPLRVAEEDTQPRPQPQQLQDKIRRDMLMRLAEEQQDGRTV